MIVAVEVDVVCCIVSSTCVFYRAQYICRVCPLTREPFAFDSSFIDVGGGGGYDRGGGGGGYGGGGGGGGGW